MKNSTEHDRVEDEELERSLRVYASVRLSPDRRATGRMRAAVMEHARAAQAASSAVRPTRLALLRRLAPVGLAAVLAIGAGTGAALAASPGGPLYGTRLWIESAMLPASGEARVNAQTAQIGERIDEATGAVDLGNVGAADAALDAYGAEVDQAVASAAQNQASLLQLRATIAKHLTHLQSLVKPNTKATAQLQRAIAKSQAALAVIDQRLAALPASPAP